jgi:putative endonuclease
LPERPGAAGQREADTVQRGAEAERFAARYLEARGVRILTYNYRWRRGEIDLIGLDGETLCFIEVRYRRCSDHGSALATVGRPKQRRVGRTAEHFLTYAWSGGRCACRFDVLAIDGALDEEPPVTWIKDAFQL